MDLQRPFKRRPISGKQKRRELSLLRQFQYLLREPEARNWFSRQFMLPQWMIDVPDNLSRDWYVLARPVGKRCLVVSSEGKTVSRIRNGSILHQFDSSLSGGACSILDCIFHESDQTYYVIDMVCWRGYWLYECTAEFRFFWLETKIAEVSGASEFRFSAVPVYNCDQSGLHSAYTRGSSSTPYVKDGLLFYNKHGHYHTRNTPLVLIWKDENCSQYVIDTDNNGDVPNQQHSGLSSGSLIRFSIAHGGRMNCVEGRFENADLQYIGVSRNRVGTFADSYSKIMFQYMARHSPLKVDHLTAMISQSPEIEMSGLTISQSPEVEMSS